MTSDPLVPAVPGPPAEAPRRRSSIWRELPILLLIAMVLALLLKTFLVQAFYIPSGSMEQTLQVGDRVLVSKLSYRFGEPQRGDIVVFNGVDSWEAEVQLAASSNPLSQGLRWVAGTFGFATPNEKDFIKRVIGIPGDHVVCCDPQGRLVVNGVAVDEQYLFPGDVPSQQEFDITVPDGRLWVMGDHRSSSSDSRFHTGDPGGGTVAVDKVIGRAFAVVWPLSDAGWLTRPDVYDDPALGASAQPSRTPAVPAARAAW
jgi:signal peptidase I